VGWIKPKLLGREEEEEVAWYNTVERGEEVANEK